MFRISIKTFSLAVLFVTLFIIINSIAGATTPQCDDIDPRYAQSGKTEDVTIYGIDTHFDDTSQVSFSCQGVTVKSVTANSATKIVVSITIACDAPRDSCDVKVTTGTEQYTCPEAFEIIPAFPCGIIRDVIPSTGRAGETLNVKITTCDINLQGAHNLEVIFSSASITVNSTTITGSTEMTVNITIDECIPSEKCFLRVKSSDGCGIEEYAPFSIDAKLCTLEINPGSVRTGLFFPRIREITIKGTCSNFDSSSTVDIYGMRTIKVLETTADKIRALVLIPPKFRTISENKKKAVTVTTGGEECTGIIEVK